VTDSVDPACLAALVAQIGHAEPFTDAELAGVKSLTITHARDINILARCTGLEHLRLVACELERLRAIGELESLTQLEIHATRLSSSLGVNAPTLQRVEVLFSSLTTADDFLGADLHWQGAFNGTPLNETDRGAFHELVEGGFSLIDCGTQQDWEECRQLHERLGGCSGALGDNYGLLVRPGIPTLTKNEYDAIRVIPGTASSALDDADVTLEKLFEQHADKIEAPDLSELASQRVLGFAKDATQWIADSALSEPDKAALDSFVTRFPKMVFYRVTKAGNDRREQLSNLKLPDGYRALRETLDGWWPQTWLAPPVQFDTFDDSSSPRASRVTSYVYSLGFRNHGADQRAQMLKAGFICVGWSTEEPNSSLAIRLDGDPTLYEYSREDISDAISEGEDVTASIYPAFRSYAAMLGHVQAIHLPNRVVAAKS
jgi:hypothetical protein